VVASLPGPASDRQIETLAAAGVFLLHRNLTEHRPNATESRLGGPRSAPGLPSASICAFLPLRSLRRAIRAASAASLWTLQDPGYARSLLRLLPAVAAVKTDNIALFASSRPWKQLAEAGEESWPEAPNST
jgi:hypothetical protein